jgi:hypothetical protein
MSFMGSFGTAAGSCELSRCWGVGLGGDGRGADDLPGDRIVRFEGSGDELAMNLPSMKVRSTSCDTKYLSVEAAGWFDQCAPDTPDRQRTKR